MILLDVLGTQVGVTTTDASLADAVGTLWAPFVRSSGSPARQFVLETADTDPVAITNASKPAKVNASAIVRSWRAVFDARKPPHTMPAADASMYTAYPVVAHASDMPYSARRLDDEKL